MRKWIIGFFIVGTILWMYSYHEEHMPCQVVRNDRIAGSWNCPAGVIRLALNSKPPSTVTLIVSAPVALTYQKGVWSVGVGRAFVIHNLLTGSVMLDSKVPFTVNALWFHH